jgi:hypothetical protein
LTFGAHSQTVSPSKLVPVRRYLWAEYAGPDQHLLAEHGIIAYIKGKPPHTGAALMVEEADQDKALEVLSAAPAVLAETLATNDLAPRCPRCGSSDIRGRPAYALIVLLIGASLSAALIVYGYSTLAFEITVGWIVLATILFLKVARWECQSCHATYRGNGG